MNVDNTHGRIRLRVAFTMSFVKPFHVVILLSMLTKLKSRYSSAAAVVN